MNARIKYVLTAKIVLNKQRSIIYVKSACNKVKNCGRHWCYKRGS